MRTKLDQMLDTMNMELIRMGAMCQEAISCAVHGMLCGQEEMTEKTFAIERAIDEKEREIEGLCMKLLLRQQPVAKDLRVVSVALKMIRDMERIGDQSADIAEISRHIENDNVFGRVHVKEMAEAAIKMVTDSINSFVARDVAAARKVVADDDTVDGLFLEVRRELVAALAENSVVGESCIDILMIAKYLERIGDHATNIAEWVEYSVTGVHVGESVE
ncbi:MAG: phosphate signaling complex protein PhoU [Spirochaetaceae bacterium]|nr:phosphate signaling complex protein PhoU [Spirochaetaceae bacterium]